MLSRNSALVIAGLGAVAVLAVAACSASGTVSTGPAHRHHATQAAKPKPKPVRHLTAAEVTRALAKSEPVGKVRVLTASTDPNHLLGRPGGYVSKTLFADRRVRGESLADGTVAGGSVEVYPAAAGALSRGKYLARVSAAIPVLGTEYDYVAGPVLLRLSGRLTPVQAKGYERALARITGQAVRAVR